MDEHAYIVALPTTAYVTVYAATSGGDALAQARAMLDALDLADAEHEMNHGRINFDPPPCDAPARVRHDAACLSPEHDED